MFGKLVKNEFRNIGRLLLLINTIVLGIHLLSIVFESVYNSGVFNGTVFRTIFGAFGAIYIFSIIAVNIIIVIIFAARFYRKVYSVEGYLTHTLPVKKSAIYAAILVSSSIGTLITSVLSTGYPILRLVNEMLVSNSLSIRDAMNFLARFNVTGYNLFLMGVGAVLSLFYAFSLIFLCVSIGQNWKAHPVLGSILAYWVITTILQVLSVIAFVLLANSELANTLFSMEEFFKGSVTILTYLGIGCELIGIAITSVISIVIMKKKLDLQ